MTAVGRPRLRRGRRQHRRSRRATWRLGLPHPRRRLRRQRTHPSFDPIPHTGIAATVARSSPTTKGTVMKLRTRAWAIALAATAVLTGTGTAYATSSAPAHPSGPKPTIVLVHG